VGGYSTQIVPQEVNVVRGELPRDAGTDLFLLLALWSLPDTLARFIRSMSRFHEIAYHRYPLAKFRRNRRHPRAGEPRECRGGAKPAIARVPAPSTAPAPSGRRRCGPRRSQRRVPKAAAGDSGHDGRNVSRYLETCGLAVDAIRCGRLRHFIGVPSVHYRGSSEQKHRGLAGCTVGVMTEEGAWRWRWRMQCRVLWLKGRHGVSCRCCRDVVHVAHLSAGDSQARTS
jgi:hypothetical protein